MILPYLSIIYNFYNKTKVKNGENNRPSTSSNSPDHNGRPPNTYCSITTKPHTITNASPTDGGVGGAVAVIDPTSTIRVDIPNRKRTRRRNFSDKFEHVVRGTLEWTQLRTCQCQTRLESLAYHINFVISNSTGENNIIWYTPHQS